MTEPCGTFGNLTCPSPSENSNRDPAGPRPSLTRLLALPLQIQDSGRQRDLCQSSQAVGEEIPGLLPAQFPVCVQLEERRGKNPADRPQRDNSPTPRQTALSSVSFMPFVESGFSSVKGMKLPDAGSEIRWNAASPAGLCSSPPATSPLCTFPSKGYGNCSHEVCTGRASVPWQGHLLRGALQSGLGEQML